MFIHSLALRFMQAVAIIESEQARLRDQGNVMPSWNHRPDFGHLRFLNT